MFVEVDVGKVKLLYETKWVERPTTLEEFREMNEAILDCLTAMLNNVEQCRTMSNNVEQCPTMSNNVQQCPTMSNNVQQ